MCVCVCVCVCARALLMFSNSLRIIKVDRNLSVTLNCLQKKFNFDISAFVWFNLLKPSGFFTYRQV